MEITSCTLSKKRGIIWMFPNEKDAAEPVVFLDITNRVASNNNEEGLLGLAFIRICLRIIYLCQLFS